MGQKINPFLYRVILNKNWNSSWCTSRKNFSNFLIEDIDIRNFLFKLLKNISIWKILIQKSDLFIYVIIFLKKKKIVFKSLKITVDDLSNKLSYYLGRDCYVFLKNIPNPGLNPFLIFYRIKRKIEQKKPFKNILKSIFKNSLKSGALGVKILIKGRINNSSMSKTQLFKEGSMPLQRIVSNIIYYSNFVLTNYGVIGIKVWVYIGDFDYT